MMYPVNDSTIPATPSIENPMKNAHIQVNPSVLKQKAAAAMDPEAIKMIEMRIQGTT